MEQLIVIRSVMKPRDYSTLRSLLKEEQGEKINPNIFKLENSQNIQDYLKKARLAKQKEQEQKRKEQEIERKMNDGKNWGSIHLDFKGEWGEDYKRRWVAGNFTYSQVKEWIDVGIEPAG